VGLIVEKTPMLSASARGDFGMADLLGSPDYKVQALEVIIDSM